MNDKRKQFVDAITKYVMLNMSTVYCTILDVCLAKEDERLFLIQVNNEFIHKDIVYRFGDVLDIRNQANHKRCSGLVVQKLGDDQEHFLPGFVKGNFTKLDLTPMVFPVTSITKPVPQPPCPTQNQVIFPSFPSNAKPVPKPGGLTQPPTIFPLNSKPVPQPPGLDGCSKPALPLKRQSSGNIFQQTPRNHVDINKNVYPQTRKDVDNFTSTTPLFPTQDKSSNRFEAIKNEVDVFLKQIGCYDELMKKKFKYLERVCEESQLLEDFSGKEVCARTIFHFLYRGWRPVMHAPQNWKNKSPKTYSVSELYLYMMSNQKRVLGSLLKGLSVDGALMYHILKDDIILCQVLPDQSSVREDELIELRKDFTFT